MAENVDLLVWIRKRRIAVSASPAIFLTEYPCGGRVQRDCGQCEQGYRREPSGLDMGQALKLGASKDQFDPIPYFRFAPAAHNDFLGWRANLESRLRSGELPAAVEGHLEHVPPELNRQDSHGVLDRRFYRH